MANVHRSCLLSKEYQDLKDKKQGLWLSSQDRNTNTSVSHSVVPAVEQNLSYNRQLLAHWFMHSNESVMVTNTNNKIIQVNAAFSKITGYSEAEALGQTPALIQSTRHDALFYKTLWQELDQTGCWSGRVWNRRKTGEVYLQWLNINTLTDEQGRITHRVGIGKDLSSEKIDEQQRNPFIFKDPLTELGNRQLLTSRLAQALAGAEKNNLHVGLMLIDIGRFKQINEQLGLKLGDEVLRQQATVLQAAVHEADTLVRLQGDLFAILRHSHTQDSNMAHLADHILALMSEPLLLADATTLNLQPSIGIAVYPQDATENTSLLQAAEYAHGMAKRAGRNCFQFVDQQQQDLHHRELLIENSLYYVLTPNQGEGLSLFYQPQVCTSTGDVVALEALLRWQHSKLGPLSPAEFIPIAEQSSQSVLLDRWVIEQVCMQVALWRECYAHVPVVSINISAQQFSKPDFIDWLQSCVTRAGLTNSCIKLELTETTMMENSTHCIAMLQQLRDLGFRISLDDFGTGYSALSCLHQFPLDELKIDRSFMVEACESQRAYLLLKTIVSLAQDLSLNLVVEGVELQEQIDLLVNFGPVVIQGYFYYRPLPVVEINALLANINKG